jgi:hypothetical protein
MYKNGYNQIAIVLAHIIAILEKQHIIVTVHALVRVHALTAVDNK